MLGYDTLDGQIARSFMLTPHAIALVLEIFNYCLNKTGMRKLGGYADLPRH
jgi:hypothetical protein